MLVLNKLAVAALVLLPLTTGQHPYHPADYLLPGLGNGIPPIHPNDCLKPLPCNDGRPRVPAHAATPHPPHGHHRRRHYALRHGRRRNVATNETTTAENACAGSSAGIHCDPIPTVTPRIDCGPPPLVPQETGCVCFNINVLKTQPYDEVDYCSFYASKPVDDNDPCKHLYPPGFASVYGSTYTDAESTSFDFGYSHHYDPEIKGGYCYADISTYTDKYSGDEGTDGEYHSYSLWFDVTEEELEDCKNNMNELKEYLEALPNGSCSIDIGNGYYY